jgi:tRNA 2-thiouridine synthesizing protein A
VTEGAAEDWDAGAMGCGELLIGLRKRLLAIPGGTLRLIATDPGAVEDIPAWCRITGHHLLKTEGTSYWIRARSAAS